MHAVMQIDLNSTNIKSAFNALTTPFSPVTPCETTSNTISFSNNNDQPKIKKERFAVCSNNNGIKSQSKYSLYSVFRHKDYIPLKQITKTLQGSIWQVTTKNGLHNFIVKVANKSLVRHSAAKYRGKKVHTQENFFREVEIMKYLNRRNAPNAIIKFVEDFGDYKNYFLVMQHGESSFFDFVKDCHDYIKKDMLNINEWHRFCKAAMHEMVETFDWMHNTMNTCHLDISLENITIQNLRNSIVMRSGKITFVPNFQIKIIDFGVAEVFRKNKNGISEFRYNKYVGKQTYQCPEIVSRKKVYNAASADCWSLGVTFFMMFFGMPPWRKASKKDKQYNMVMMKGFSGIVDVLDRWNRILYLTPAILDLLTKIFVGEKDRLTMEQMKHHCFFD